MIFGIQDLLQAASPSKSPIYAGTDGYLNTCKNCVDNLFTQYTDFFGGNEERAIERICQLFDFYFNESGELVIAFDEYEVAPGYMGAPEFVIPQKVTAGLLK